MTTTDSAPGKRQSSSAWSWLLPVLTFLVGLVLGGVVVAAGASDDGDDVADPSPTTTRDSSPGASTATPSGGLVVRVPQSCLDAADRAVAVSEQAEDAVAAVRDLDARRLQEVVDRVQQLEPEVRRLADRCRETTGARLEDDELATPGPAATPGS